MNTDQAIVGWQKAQPGIRPLRPAGKSLWKEEILADSRNDRANRWPSVKPRSRISGTFGKKII
jgi:hypothetical protein